MDRAGRAADHADRIDAVHAGVRDLEPLELRPLAGKSRIVVVRGGTGPHAVVAAGAAIQVDHHRGGAVDEAIIDQKLQQPRLHLSVVGRISRSTIGTGIRSTST
jgi:hypothetical protein